MKKLTITLAIILIALLAERFIFHTTKIIVEINPPVLRANISSFVILEIIPVNTLGFRTPFAKSQARFDVEEGANLVELVQNIDYNRAVVRSKGIEGEAIIGIYSLKSGMLLQRITIKIIQNDYT